MTLVKRKESMFPSVWNDLFDNDFFRTPNVAQAGITVPAVNIKESPEKFDIELAIPGKKKEDFNIHLDQNLLTICSEEKNETVDENKNENYTRREYSYSSFTRTFTLPETADSEKINATYNNGILNVSINKKEEAKAKAARTIAIS